MEQARPLYNKRAYFYSVLIHAALIALLIKVTVLVDVDPPPFYEINLGAISQERMQQILTEARRAERAQSLDDDGATPGKRVEVPKRKMLEIEEPTISVPLEQRVTPNEIIKNAERQTFEVTAPSFDLPAADKSIFTMDRKENFEGSRITVGEQPGTGMETGIIGDEPFIIEGEVEGREIVANPLPKYPSGLNENDVAIKIHFVVLKDGTVSSSGLYPIRKENAVLEDISMKTLRQLWRFSPMPQGETATQTGVITFIYRVE